MQQNTIIAPHGGKLVNCSIAAPAQEELAGLPRLELQRRNMSDLELITEGAFSPLEGARVNGY